MKINLASGQRPFPKPWVNIDVRKQDYHVDHIADIRHLTMIDDDSVDVLVAHHCLEHIDMSQILDTSKEWYRVLKPGGKLIVFVPNMRPLVERWLAGQIDDYTFNVNVYGAFQGHLEDLHRWSYTFKYLREMMTNGHEVKWSRIQELTPDMYRKDPAYEGSDCAFDWWILAVEFTK